MKAFIEPALSTALGIGIASVAAIGLFLIANRLFGLFNYADLSREDVDKVAQKYLGNVVTKADGVGYSRGVINTGGSLYYFSWKYGRSFEIYPLFYERYSSDRDLLGAPRLSIPV